MALYVTTVGTSAYENLKRSSLNDQAREISFRDDMPDHAIKEEAAKLVGFINALPEGEHCYEPAELACLKKHPLYCEPDAKVILLSSQTGEGRVCAYALAKILSDQDKLSDDYAGGVKVIDGLDMVKTSDAWVIDLVKTLADLWVRHKQEAMYFNITGGFKVAVPIIGIVSSVTRVPMIYLHEAADLIIELKSLPTESEIMRKFFQLLEAALMPANADAFDKWCVKHKKVFTRENIDGLYDRDTGKLSTAGLALKAFYEEESKIGGLSPAGSAVVD